MRALIFIVTLCIVTTAMAKEATTECPAMAESREIVKKDIKISETSRKKTASKQ